LFLLFGFFCQVWLQQESILFGPLIVAQARLKLVSGGLVDGRCLQVGSWAGGQVTAGVPAGQWAGDGLAGLQGSCQCAGRPVGWWGGGIFFSFF
jgi:hypothetical protein